MANQELESRTIEVNRDKVLSVEASLMVSMHSRMLSTISPGSLADSPYNESLHQSLIEKFRTDMVGVENEQVTVYIDMNEREIDYLNGQFLWEINGWPSEERLVAILGDRGKDKDSIDRMIDFQSAVIRRSSDRFMAFNLAWNRAGGTPRPDFLRFQTLSGPRQDPNPQT